MSGAIPPFPNTPLSRGAQHRDNFALLYLIMEYDKNARCHQRSLTYTCSLESDILKLI